MKQTDTAVMTTLQRFSFKSALIILLAAAFGGIFLPLMAQSVGINSRIVNVLGLSISISFATAFTRCFLDSDHGFDRTFLKTFLIFLVFTTIIAYFWVYQNVYM